MITFDIVFTGRLRSQQANNRSKSASLIITNNSIQARLESVASTIGVQSTARRTVRDIEYVALFDEKWALKVEALFFVNPEKNQRSDLDQIWLPLQNALAIPNPNVNVIGAAKGRCYHTVVVDDRQFIQIKLDTICHRGCLGKEDLTLIRLTALPPPHLELAFPPPARRPSGKGEP
jgi:hypothetical protein